MYSSSWGRLYTKQRQQQQPDVSSAPPAVVANTTVVGTDGGAYNEDAPEDEVKTRSSVRPRKKGWSRPQRLTVATTAAPATSPTATKLEDDPNFAAPASATATKKSEEDPNLSRTADKTPSSTSAPAGPTSEPGACWVSGIDPGGERMDDEEEDAGQDPEAVGADPPNMQSGVLLEADLVGNEPPAPLVEGKFVEESTQSQVRKWPWILVAVVVAAAVVIVAVLFGRTASTGATALTRSNESTGVGNSSKQSLINSFQSSLPKVTRDALRYPSSPQSQAMAWLSSTELTPYNQEQMTQRFALATFFYSTFGYQGWVNNTGWLNQSLTECNWFGCNCTSSAAVEYIDLAANGIQGSMPPELGLLSQLKILYLDSNSLTGSIPTELGLLTDLTVLSIHGSGTNPTSQPPTELGLLTKLHLLDLRKNNLSGPLPPWLTNLSQLSQLNLGLNSFNGSIGVNIASLTKLTYLCLAANSLWYGIPSEMGALTNLKYLTLFNNDLVGTIPMQLSYLSQLTLLELGRNRIAATIPIELGVLTNLNHLSLSNNSLTGSIPSQLSGLSQLQWLDLSINYFTNFSSELGTLTTLTALSLSGNIFSESIPSQFGQLTELGELYLSFNYLIGSIPAELSALTKLTEMTLNSNLLTGNIPTGLVKLANANQLKLDIDCGELNCNPSVCICH